MLRSVAKSLLTLALLGTCVAAEDAALPPVASRLAEPRPASGSIQPLDFAPVPLPKASTLTSSEHLRQAIEHLKEAGLEEDAANLQRKLDDLQEQRLTDLQEKRRLLLQLQCEIAELEQQTGLLTQYHLEAKVGEIMATPPNSQTLNGYIGFGNKASGTIDLPVDSGVTFSVLGVKWPPLAHGKVYQPSEFQQELENLKSHYALKILSAPSLTTTAGQLARVQISCAPKVAQVSGSSETGLSNDCICDMNGIITPFTKDQVHLQLTYNICNSLPVPTQQVTFASPTQSAAASAEARLAGFGSIDRAIPTGKTLVVLSPEFERNGEKWQRFMALTVTEGTTAAPVSHKVKLEPIPDDVAN
ncbi:hypothetical protein [Planctomicrobium sp. SH664]|uniref:hypothetical protein n=1 Tax=Planctomicrobium sp. SH664 TaxID=3448125 RepID=UPI003F5BEAED